MSGAINEVPEDKKSTAMGFFQSIYSIGMTLGPILMGAMIGAFQYSVSFIAVGIFALSAAAMAIMLGRKSIKRASL
jgi:predicted MFS family arabinose efflux permease